MSVEVGVVGVSIGASLVSLSDLNRRGLIISALSARNFALLNIYLKVWGVMFVSLFLKFWFERIQIYL